MAVSDHLPRIVKQRVRIATVDPTNRIVEGIGKDGAVLQIAVFDVANLFRWPQVGEYWTIRRENGPWFLDAKTQDSEVSIRIEDINAGDYLIEGSGTVHMGPNLKAYGSVQVLGTLTADSLIVPTTTVTSLPSTPYEGQTIDLLVSGIIWRLRYRSTAPSAYKWEFVGGSSLFDANDAASTTTSSYGNGSVTPPQVTVPYAGDYELAHGFQATTTSTSPDIITQSVKIGTATTLDAEGTAFDSYGNGPGFTGGAGVSRTMVRNVPNPNTLLKTQVKGVNNVVSVTNRWLRVIPVRVG